MRQSKYIADMLKTWNMEDCKPVKDPMTGSNFDTTGQPVDVTLYRKLIGSLLYLAVITRPDICFAVNKLAQYNSAPLQCHFTAAKRILRYLKGTQSFGLRYYRNAKMGQIISYTDADWANNQEERKSVTGIVIKLAEEDSPIIWKSTKQRLVTLSSCESEYIALTVCIQETQFVVNVFKSIELPYEKPKLYTDNQSVIAITKNPVISQRSKHIDIKYHFARNFIQQGNGTLQYVESNANIADMLTKPIRNEKLENMRRYHIQDSQIEEGC